MCGAVDGKGEGGTHGGAEEGKEGPLSLLEILVRVCLEVEGGLASLLVRGCLDLDLELCHDLLHDLAEGSRFAVLAGGGEVDGGEGEGLGDLVRMDGRGLDAGADGAAPRGCGRLVGGGGGGGEGGEGVVGGGVDGLSDGGGRLGEDRGGLVERREWVRGTFELVVPSLQGEGPSGGSACGCVDRAGGTGADLKISSHCGRRDGCPESDEPLTGERPGRRAVGRVEVLE